MLMDFSPNVCAWFQSEPLPTSCKRGEGNGYPWDERKPTLFGGAP